MDPSGYAKKCGTGSESGTDTTRVRHYTNSKGLKGIEESGIIYAQDNNRVYMEYAKKEAIKFNRGRRFLSVEKGKRKKLC